MYPRLGTPDLCQCDEPMHDSFCEIRSLRYNDPSKVRKCAVAPPDHLLSEISFSRTCNFPNFVSHVVYAAEPFYHRNRLTGCVTTWLRNCIRTKPTFAQCKHLLNIKFLRGKHCSEVTYSLWWRGFLVTIPMKPSKFLWNEKDLILEQCVYSPARLPVLMDTERTKLLLVLKADIVEFRRLCED